MPRRKTYPVIAQVLAGVRVSHDYEEASFPETATVVLYRTKTRNRWGLHAQFTYKNKRYEVYVPHCTISDYGPSDEQVRAVNGMNNRHQTAEAP